MSVQWAILVIVSILILGGLGLTKDVYSQVGDTTKIMNMTPVTSPTGSVAVTLSNPVDTAEALAATVYYVDSFGIDGCGGLSGTATSPFETIQGAIDCIAFLHGPALTNPVEIEVSGDGPPYTGDIIIDGLGSSAGATLTIRAAAGQMPIIDGGDFFCTGFDVRDDYVTIDGFFLKDFSSSVSYANGIQIDGNSNLVVRNSIIDAKADFGILLGFRCPTSSSVSSASNDVSIHNNVIMNTQHDGTDSFNQGDGIHIMSGAERTKIESNTFYGFASDGIFFMVDLPEPDSLIRNNIFYPTVDGSTGIDLSDITSQVGFSSDYNIFFDTGGVVFNVGFWDGGFQNDLVDWQGAPAFQDSNGIDADPLFRTLGSDFHVQSTNGVWNGADFSEQSPLNSPAIDAGDPSYSFANEPSPNGGRINIGAYGNTAEASLSAPTGGGPPVGGTYLPLDTTSLLIAGVTTTTPWLIFGIVAAVGIGLAVFTLKRSR